MKTIRPGAVLVLLIVAIGRLPAADAPPSPPPAVAKAPTPPPLSPRLQQVRNRIDALFSHRNSTPAPLDPRYDPFRPSGPFIAGASTTATPTDGRTGALPPPEAPPSDMTLLQQAIATLKIGGRFEGGGREHRMVNARLYKEGDVIQTQLQGQPVYLRVKGITQKTLTLSLNDAETTLTF